MCDLTCEVANLIDIAIKFSPRIGLFSYLFSCRHLRLLSMTFIFVIFRHLLVSYECLPDRKTLQSAILGVNFPNKRSSMTVSLKNASMIQISIFQVINYKEIQDLLSTTLSWHWWERWFFRLFLCLACQ